MDNLKSKLHPIIGKIAIGYGAISILFYWLSINVKSLQPLGAFVFPYFTDPTGILVRYSKSGPGINPLMIFFFLLMIIGGFLYQRTNKLDARLLQFTFSILFFKGCLQLIWGPINYFHFIKLINQHNVNFSGSVPTMWSFIWPILIVIPITYFAYHFTKWLIADQKILIKEKNKEGEIVESAVVASKGKRFWHYTFDLLLMLLILTPIFTKLGALLSASVFINTFSLMQSSQLVLTVVIFSVQMIYYIFFEGFFQATPIKFLTGSRVVHSETLEKPRFLQIAGRSLARHIPFDAFSFFGTIGWHDSASNTSVVEENTQGHSRKYHGWWGILFFSVFIGSFAYAKLQPEIQRKRNYSFQLKVGSDIRKARLANLKTGDVILTHKTKESYKTNKRYFRVSAINGDQYKAYVFQAPYKKTRWANTVFETIISSKPMDTISFSKQKIYDAITPKRTLPFEVDNGQTYAFIQIFNLDHPTFKSAGSTSRSNNNDPIRTFSFNYSTNNLNSLLPIGELDENMPSLSATQSLEILHIKTIKGRAEWIDNFPVSSQLSPSGAIFLKAKNISETKHLKAEVVLKYNNSEYIYIFEWQDGHSYLYRQGKK